MGESEESEDTFRDPVAEPRPGFIERFMMSPSLTFLIPRFWLVNHPDSLDTNAQTNSRFYEV